MSVWQETTSERVRLAELLARLTEQQWATASLCEGWDVREMVCHLVDPISTPLPVLLARFAITLARAGGDFDRANRLATRRLADRPVVDLVTLLREHADSRFAALDRLAGDGVAPLASWLQA
jgi:uncharacterized protein (TIGR03083 family)